MSSDEDTTRSIRLSTSLHFKSLAKYRAAGQGTPVLAGQTAEHVDNGYGLQGNPTLHELQDSVSELEKGKYTLLFPSGSTALVALAALLKSGDHWLMPDSVYAPVKRYAEYLKDMYGVTYDFYDTGSIDSVKNAIKPETKLIHIENPSSAIFATTDVEGIVGLAKSKGIITSADNTWASGILYRPLEHGVDISILSLTKYPSGYSDVFMGSLTTSNEDLYKKLSYHHRVYGFTVSPFSAMLVNRGLESLEVRLAAHGANAKRLIDAAQGRPKVTKVHFVDTNQSKDFSGINGLFSIELDRKYSDDELEKAFAVLEVFAIGESWGGTRSLVLPFQPEEFASHFTPPQNTIIRFHSGLDNIDNQIEDLSKFLTQIENLG
jgi:cystathionine beta-lyase